MRHIAVGLAVALSLLGCSGPAPTRGAQVPLLTDVLPGSATFVNVVIDVAADPETGTPIIEVHGVSMRWPTGYTAWRVGSETEVLDPAGNRVVVTGQRYRFYPGPDYGSEPQPGVYIPAPYRVIAYIEPCPPDLFGRPTCVLGVHQQGDY